MFLCFLGSVSSKWLKWTILPGGRRHTFNGKEIGFFTHSKQHVVTLRGSFLHQIHPSNTRFIISINRSLDSESIGRDKSLVLEAFRFPFVVPVVLTNPVWAGFGCMEVNVESKGGGKHWLKCNLGTHRLLSDGDFCFILAFFLNLHLYANICL